LPEESKEADFNEDCDEKLDSVNIPRNSELIDQKNSSFMQVKDLTEEAKEAIKNERGAEVRFIDRVVFKERPFKLTMDRGIQAARPRKDAQNQAFEERKVNSTDIL
jgi:hypothetical protein